MSRDIITLDNIHERINNLYTRLKEMDVKINEIMTEMIDRGWMEKEETGEVNNKPSNQTTTYDVNVQYNTK